MIKAAAQNGWIDEERIVCEDSHIHLPGGRRRIIDLLCKRTGTLYGGGTDRIRSGKNMDRSEQLFERAIKVIPGGVNSPVRAYQAVGGIPRFIASADREFITDVDGRKRILTISAPGAP